MTSPILLLAGRFLLASALLMALYWVVWRKQATYRAKRIYLLTMPFVALAISLLQVEVYKPEPVVVEVSRPSGPSPIPSPIPSQGRGVDTPSGIDLPKEKMADSEVVSEQSTDAKANSAALSEGQGISLPPLGEGKGWGLGLCLLYALIILLFCIPFVVNLVLVRRLRKEASIAEEEKEADIHILTGEGVKAPFSFHRTIFLPTNLTEAQRRMILAHEQAHILHRHYVDVWVAEAITRLLWWNPFLWWARQELRNVHEFEADSNVLATGEDVYAYQAILIEEVLHGDIVIANGFNHSFIRRRFVEMLQSTNRRMSSMAKAGTAAWMLLVIALMCCTVGEAEVIYKEAETLSDIAQGEVAVSHEPAIAEHTERLESYTGSDAPLPTLEEKKDEATGSDTDELDNISKDLEQFTKEASEIQGTIGNVLSRLFKSLFNSMAGSLTLMTQETYDSLKSLLPADEEVASLEEINKGLELLRDSLQTVMNTLYPRLKPGEVVDVPVVSFNTKIDPAIDTSYQAQNDALLRFIANWFELSENGVFLSKSEYEKKNIDIEEYPSYEEYSKNWNTNIVLETQLLSRYLNKLNSELRPQVEALLKEHGWIIPREKDLYITIRSDAFNKTWTFKKRPRSSGITVGPLTEQEILRMKEDVASKTYKQLFMCFTSWGLYYSPNISGVNTDEYKIAKKIQPDLPKASEVNQSKELTWRVKQLYIEHLLKDVNEEVANQVRNVIKKYSTDDYLGKDLYFTIDLGTHEIHVKKEKGKELTSQFLWEKGKPLPEGFLPSEKNKAATNTSANEPAITNDASLREQDEALQAFFRGWFDMNKMAQEPVMTEKEFQQALKTEPIPPGAIPTYEEYKERRTNNLKAALLKMEDGRARLNKEIRPQVEAVLKQHGMQFPPERQLKIIIRAAYKNATWEFMNSPNAYGCAVNTNFLIVDDPSSPDYNEKKDFISPQWGLELPEGYVRLTDYKKLAETDATAKAQYNQLMSCFRNAQALRKEALTNAYKEKHPRYVSVEEATMAGIKKLFRNAGIEMLEKGAYRLPDGTIVMEDDQHNLVPQSVDYQQGTTDRDPRLCNKAPRMERDKSPNYSPFNEQTWPVYTNVQTVPTNEYTPEPQVFRGKNCTYVVEHFHIVYNFHWFYISPSSKLVDTKTNDQYVKRYTEHFHSNNYVWIHGMEGKVIRLIVVFPPLPKNVTAVDYIPGRIPADERLSNASPYKEYKKLKVQELDESKGMKVVY